MDGSWELALPEPAYTKGVCRYEECIRRKGKEHKNAKHNAKIIKEELEPETQVIDRRAKHELFDRVNLMKQILEDEEGNEILVNLSAGSKIDAIAGMLGVMLFGKKATPFYVEPETYEVLEEGKSSRKSNQYFSETKGMKDTIKLPIMKISKPTPAMLHALSAISQKQGGKMKKKELVKELIGADCLEGFKLNSKRIIVKKSDLEPEKSTKQNGAIQSGALHVCENNIFRALKTEWKAIREDEKPKNRNITLTDKGTEFVKIFFGNGQTQKRDS